MPFEIARQYASQELDVLEDDVKKKMWNDGDLTRDENGHHNAIGATGLKVCIRETDQARGKLFQRRAIKFPSDGPSYPVDVLVAELDGVRVYVDEQRQAIVVTREDLEL